MYANETEQQPNDRLFDSRYKAINEMVRNGNLCIKLILANPRTGSTLLETSFIQSPAVRAHVHEPFHRRGNAGDIQTGYEVILEEVETEVKKTKDPVNVVIKEISRGLTGVGEHQRFLSLTNSPPLLLIRNPLLSTESKIKAVLRSLTKRKSGSLIEVLRECLGHSGLDFGSLDQQSILDEEHSMKIQNQMLDHFAQTKGFNTWKEMLVESFTNQDFRLFEDLLADVRIYRLEPSSTLEIMRYLQSRDRSFIIVDCTDFRIDPRSVLQAVCERWELPFSEDMVEWGTNGRKLVAGRQDLDEWFGRVKKSTKIIEPVEFSPTLSAFPDFIASHLESVELPAYFAMFNNVNRVVPGVDILKKTFAVVVPVGICQELSEAGFTEIIASGNSGARFFNLPIMIIDPTYSLLSQPHLIDEEKFIILNKRHMQIVGHLQRLSTHGSSFENRII